MADGSQDPRHPKSSYAGKYPYNRVEVTESGHELHFDDTPGKERLRMAHRTGTYFEISPDGKKTELVTGHHIVYNKKGHTLTVDKNMDVKVGGSHRTSISGDQHKEVKGTVSHAFEGDHRTIVGGDKTTAVGGDHTHGVVGNSTTKIGGSSNTKHDGNTHTITDGSQTMQVGKDVVYSSETKITFKVGGSTITMTPGGITLKSDKNVTDGPTYLGSPDAAREVGGKGSVDSQGDKLVGQLAPNVYIPG